MREEWRERIRDIRAASTIWWWWYFIKWHRHPTTFCLILGHHQWCVYCESDVTLACTLLLCKYWAYIIIYTGVLGKQVDHESFINKFPPDIMNSMLWLERIYSKMGRHRMSISFNEININEEMLPKHTHTHTHTHTHVCVCVCECM